MSGTHEDAVSETHEDRKAILGSPLGADLVALLLPRRAESRGVAERRELHGVERQVRLLEHFAPTRRESKGLVGVDVSVALDHIALALIPESKIQRDTGPGFERGGEGLSRAHQQKPASVNGASGWIIAL